MLFDTGPDYDFKLVPVPLRHGVIIPATVDDLFTPKWVHASLDYDLWENLGKYKRSVAVESGDGLRFYSVHFSDQRGPFPENYGMGAIAAQCYTRWSGAVLVLRIAANGRPMSCHVEDVLYIRELLTRYDYCFQCD